MRDFVRWIQIMVLGFALFSPMAIAAFKGKGEAADDYESFNIKTIGLVVIGTWKGSEAMVEPNVVATHIKAALRTKGYEVNDIQDKKQLKSAEETTDAILTITYQSLITGRNPDTNEVERTLRGTAEMVTTKRASKKKNTLFKAAGQTEKATSTVEGEAASTNPPQEFAEIIAKLPAIEVVQPPAKPEGEKPAEGEKKPEEGKTPVEEKKP